MKLKKNKEWEGWAGVLVDLRVLLRCFIVCLG